jgi:hypothetical protein
MGNRLLDRAAFGPTTIEPQIGSRPAKIKKIQRHIEIL